MTQAARHASVCTFLGITPGDYNGDFHALFDNDSIATGPFNGRLLAWINNRLSASLTNLPGAMAAYAATRGAASWNDLGDMGLTSNATTLAMSRNVYANGGALYADEMPILDTFFAGMTTDSLAAKMDRLYVFGLRDSVATRTSLYGGQLCTVTGTPTHTPGTGYTALGRGSATGYLRTGFIPLTDGVTFTTNAAHASVWALDNLADTSANDLGATGSTSTHAVLMVSRNASDGLQGAMNNATAGVANGSVADSRGHTIYTRRAASGAGAVALLKDGAPVTTVTTPAVARAPVEVFIGVRNNNGSAAGSDVSRGLFCASLGGDLSDANALAFYGRLGTLKTALAALA